MAILTEREVRDATQRNWDFSLKDKDPWGTFRKLQEAIEERLSPVADEITGSPNEAWLRAT